MRKRLAVTVMTGVIAGVIGTGAAAPALAQVPGVGGQSGLNNNLVGGGAGGSQCGMNNNYTGTAGGKQCGMNNDYTAAPSGGVGGVIAGIGGVGGLGQSQAQAQSQGQSQGQSQNQKPNGGVSAGGGGMALADESLPVAPAAALVLGTFLVGGAAVSSRRRRVEA
jgi:hypothetical protein